VQYTFREARTVSGVEVHWFDDTKAGGGCALPQSWRVLYRDGNDWKPVKELPASGSGQRDGPVGVVRFEPVKTNAVRLETRLQDGKSGGILEWSISE
jgi:hypothetical protein